MIVRRRSPLTGEMNELDLDITQEQIERYNQGEFVQIAFPHLTADQREFILTGYTADDWKTMFPPEPEEEHEQVEINTTECVSCNEGLPLNECPQSKRPCGHHCNHSWSHEECCWCGKVFEGEEINE